MLKLMFIRPIGKEISFDNLVNLTQGTLMKCIIIAKLRFSLVLIDKNN